MISARSVFSGRLSLAWWSTAVLLAVLLCACSREKPRPSLLLITIDTARADHMSLYGYHRPTSPRLDALARQGAWFETLISPIPQTGPACASLLTGRWPSSLGLHSNSDRLRPDPKTLAEILGGRGYQTAGFISGLPLTRTVSGIDRGFAHFDDDLPDPRGPGQRVQRRGGKTTAAVLQWLDHRKRSRPFFLWVHYYDPHGDYDPLPPYDTMFLDGTKGPFLAQEAIPEYQRRGGSTDAAEYIARYDGELRYVDTEIGKLLDALKAQGLQERTLVAVIADHGENLIEHNYCFDHGNEIYNEAVQVPFVLSGPGVPSDGRKISGIARTPDVLPTLLGLLGLESPSEVEGRSLADALVSGSVTPPREAFSEARFVPSLVLTPNYDVTPKISLRNDRFTILWRKTSGKLELYDRTQDPAENVDLSPTVFAGSEGDNLRANLEQRLVMWFEASMHQKPEPQVITLNLRSQFEQRVSRRITGR